jgi:hypothetical protein
LGKISDVARKHLREIAYEPLMMPNFIIIGAGRSGTTSVYEYLRQHPQICMSAIKETNYFAFLASQLPGSRIAPVLPWKVTSLRDYQDLFRVKKHHLAIGEASPFYLFAPGVPALIKESLPSVRLIAILRDPAERAYSAYMKYVSGGFESRPFRRAVEDEILGRNMTISGATCYVRAGMYFDLLSSYLDHFDRTQVCIYFFEDLASAPRSFLRSLFIDLGVNAEFVPHTSVRFNRGMSPIIKKGPVLRKFKRLSRRISDRLPRALYFLLLRIQQNIQQTLLEAPKLSTE